MALRFLQPATLAVAVALVLGLPGGACFLGGAWIGKFDGAWRPVLDHVPIPRARAQGLWASRQRWWTIPG